MAGTDGVASAFVGLLDSEIVLRGGGLPEPVIFTDLVREGDASYMQLRRRNHSLVRFLTGKGANAALLSDSPTLDTLVALRSAARRAELANLAMDAPAAEIDAGSTDLVQQLGLDRDGPKTQKNRMSRSELRLLPKVVHVTFTRDGFEPWTPRLLLDSDRAVLAIEATTPNFVALYQFVQDDLVVPTERQGGRRKRADRAPRGPADAREYWRGDARGTWLIRKKVDGDTVVPAATATASLSSTALAAAPAHDAKGSPSKGKFRYLSRQGSDEGAPKKKKSMVPRKVVEKTQVADVAGTAPDLCDSFLASL